MTFETNSTSTATIRGWKDLDDPTPIWFMDIDGVLNVFGRPETGHNEGSASPYHLDHFLTGERGWWHYSDGEETSDEELRQIAIDNHAHSRYPITWNPDITERIRELHESRKLRVMWMTTWGTGANYELGPLIGWPELEVVADPPAPEAQLGTIGSKWWKYHWVKSYVEASSASKFIWTDDDLKLYSSAKKWAYGKPNMWAISTNPYAGITEADMASIELFLDN